jgi:hypothetical protein
MKRSKEEKPISGELIDEMLKQGRSPEDVNALLKQLTKAVLERALQGEMTEHLNPGTEGDRQNRRTRKRDEIFRRLRPCERNRARPAL